MNRILFFVSIMMATLTAASVSAKCHKSDTDIIVEITQEFYKFQDCTSRVKQAGHGPTKDLNKALDHFTAYLDPNFKVFEFNTIGGTTSFPNVPAIRAGYTAFATEFFNGWSQHFATNLVVKPDGCKKARMIAGGGEWASLNPAAPYEQLTLSNFEVTWRWLDKGPRGAAWYIYEYKEFGNRLFQFCVPCGPTSLFFARTFPGATPEPTVPSCTACE